jgi:hypothetical protein
MRASDVEIDIMHGNRLLISAFAAWIIAAPVCLADQSWRFVVMGDSRGGYLTGVNEKVLSELVRDILQRDVDLVVFPGDLVYGAGTGLESFERQMWNWIEVMQPLYDAGVRVYACRGNHEIADMWYPLPGQLPNPADNCAKRWLKVFGNDDYPLYKLPDNGPENERYMSYSVVHKNALIVGLDQYNGLQYRPAHAINQEWLDSQLESNVKPHVFAFGHEEAFRTLHYDCLDAHPAQRDAFWNSLKAAGARAYLCCHDHYYDHARVDDGDGDPGNDIHQFIVATAGAPFYMWTPPYDGNNTDFTVEQVHHAEQFGYVLVNVDDTEVTMAWMERRDANPVAPPFYEAKDFWRYKVSPNVVVLRPQPGEPVPAGRPYTIQWKTIEGVQATKRVRVDYSLDAGEQWTAAGETDNTGTYVWSTPTASSAACLVRITGVGNPKMDDTTDGTFLLLQCPAQPAADLNGDCQVDFADLAILAGEWLAGTGQ